MMPDKSSLMNKSHKYWLKYCTYEQVGGNEDSTGAGTKLLHDQISSFLLHVSMLKNKAENGGNKSVTMVSNYIHNLKDPMQ